MKKNMEAQTEALIRLMIAARYQDAKMSLVESDEFRKRVEALPWKSGTALSVFLMQETAQVRKALATDTARQKFLAAQCSQFSGSDDRTSALKTIGAVMQADGVETKEDNFMQLITGLMKG